MCTALLRVRCFTQASVLCRTWARQHRPQCIRSSLAGRALSVASCQQLLRRQQFRTTQLSFATDNSAAGQTLQDEDAAAGESEAEQLPDDGEDDAGEAEPEDWDTAVGGIDTAGQPWAQTGLAVAQQVLQHPSMEGLELHLLQALPREKRLVIALDRLDSPVGSPSFEDLQAFQEAFAPQLAEALGQEVADQLDLEISSPGAERAVRVPEQLERFRELPMLVSWQGQQRVLAFDSLLGDRVIWALANVGANRKVKGRVILSKKQQQERFEVPLAELESVRLYLDV